MRLINFGPGEACDRLSILNLKILYGEQAGKDVKHFRDERNVLIVKLVARESKVLEAYGELAAVNAALWHAEDHLRVLKGQYTPPNQIEPGVGYWRDAAQLAFQIQDLNDRRAALVEMINKEAGEWAGQEKLT